MGTSPLCPSLPPHPPGSWYSLVHVLKICESCFPGRRRRLPTSFTGRFCSTVQHVSDHSLSLLCLHNFLLSLGTVWDAEISMTYSSLQTSKKLPRKPRGLKNYEKKVAAFLSVLLALGEAQTKRLFFSSCFFSLYPKPCKWGEPSISSHPAQVIML